MEVIPSVIYSANGQKYIQMSLFPRDCVELLQIRYPPALTAESKQAKRRSVTFVTSSYELRAVAAADSEASPASATAICWPKHFIMFEREEQREREGETHRKRERERGE